MEEKKRSFIVLGVVAGLLFLLILIGVIAKENKAQSSTYDNSNAISDEYRGQYSTEYEEAFTKEGKQILYIGSSSCGYCAKFNPHIKYLSETYDFTYYYIDAANMDSDTLEGILKRVGESMDDFGTPYVMFLENGEKYAEIPGYISESSLFDTLQKNGIIKEDETYVASSSSNSGASSNDDSQYTSLTMMDYEKYKQVYDSKEKSIIVLGQTGCGACTSFKPIINEIAKEKGITIYYVDMTRLNDQEPYDLMGSLSYFDEIESWGTPLTLIVENKKVVDSQQGYNTKEITLEFLNKNGLIK